MININNIKYEMLANRIEKTAILFELCEGLKSFFKDNPEDSVDVSFSFDKRSPKEPAYINFKCSTDEDQSVVFSNVFYFLHKCISLFDPVKSPFGLFTMCLLDNPQKVDFTFNKDNFGFIFKYADDFDGKEEWLIRAINEYEDDIDYVIVDNHPLWGKYPTTVFNKKSYDMWQEVKSREVYIKSFNEYQIFLKNAELIKKHYRMLSENQTMSLQKSCLIIFEDDKILDCIELDKMDYIKGFFDKKDSEKGFGNFIKYNSTMFELNYNLNEKMLLDIFNN